MAGTKIGGLRAAATNKAKYGNNFYANIGRKGGLSGRGKDYRGGFASNPELARLAGAKGGRKSRRSGAGATMDLLSNQSQDIIALYEEGMSIPQIANKLGFSVWSLRRWAHKNIDDYGA